LFDFTGTGVVIGSVRPELFGSPGIAQLACDFQTQLRLRTQITRILHGILRAFSVSFGPG
jgi:hypothetical protein